MYTGSHFVSLFDAEGEKLLGHSADELSELVRNGDTGKVMINYLNTTFHIYIKKQKHLIDCDMCIIIEYHYLICIIYHYFK